MTGVHLCRLEDLADGAATRFELEGHALAVVRLGDDVYVIGDTCTHQNVSLSEGEVDADTMHLECWKHGSSFSLETGEPDAFPATRPVPTYVARTDGEDVFVTLEAIDG